MAVRQDLPYAGPGIEFSAGKQSIYASLTNGPPLPANVRRRATPVHPVSISPTRQRVPLIHLKDP